MESRPLTRPHAAQRPAVDWWRRPVGSPRRDCSLQSVDPPVSLGTSVIERLVRGTKYHSALMRVGAYRKPPRQ